MINYFQLLDLPVKFDLTDAEVENHYIDLQLKYHPDQVSDIAKKNKYLKLSINLNQAYRILKQHHARAEHILALQGIDLYDPNFRSMIDSNFLRDMFQIQTMLSTNISCGELADLEALATKSYDDIVKELTLLFNEFNYQAAIVKTMELKYWNNIIHKIKSCKNGAS